MLPLDHLLTSLQLRLLVADRIEVPPDWNVDELTLPFNKIYYVYKGGASYAIDGKEFKVKAGDVALMPAKCRHSCWHQPARIFDKIWLHFDARVLGVVDLFDVIPCPPPVALASGNEIGPLLESLLAESRRGERAFSPLTINGLLSLALGKILRQAYGEADYRALPLRSASGHVGAALCHVAENYQKPLALEDLAAVVHLHPTYFSNLFRKTTGVSPMTYLRRFRVERAKGLLSTTDLRVSEVAERVGIPDVYYFSRVFKQVAGTAPAHFLESVRKGG